MNSIVGYAIYQERKRYDVHIPFLFPKCMSGNLYNECECNDVACNSIPVRICN